MSATYSGMDPQAIHDLGVQLKKAGADLNRLASTIDARTNRAAAVWRGPDVQNFQQGWNRAMRPGLMELAQAVNGLGQSAQNNAKEQIEASGGGSVGSVGFCGGDNVGGVVRGRSPESISGFINNAGRGDIDAGDGVRIQIGIDPETGRRKIIVYIDGSNFDPNSKLFILHAVGAMAGQSSMIDYVKAKIQAVGQPGDDLLLVGYSQGGVVAQQLAESSKFNSTTVLAIATPPSTATNQNVDVLAVTGFNPAQNGMDTLGGGGNLIKSSGEGLVNLLTGNKPTGVHHTETVGSDSWYEWVGASDHMDQSIYADGLDQYLDRGSAKAEYFKGKFSQFQGLDLVYDSDRQGLNDGNVGKNS